MMDGIYRRIALSAENQTDKYMEHEMEANTFWGSNRDQGFQESGPLSLWSTSAPYLRRIQLGATRDIEKKSERNVVSVWG